MSEFCGYRVWDRAEGLATDPFVLQHLETSRGSLVQPWVDIAAESQSDIRVRHFNPDHENILAEQLRTDFEQYISDYCEKPFARAQSRYLEHLVATITQEPIEPLHWKIRTSDADPENLFGYSKTIEGPSIDGVDAAVLLGTTAVDMRKMLNKVNAANFGFESRYELAMHLGAVAANYSNRWRMYPEMVQEAVVYEHTEHGRNQLCIGGDVHGDFRVMTFHDTGTDTITPFGQKVDFAPIRPVASVAGYHSTEPGLFVKIMEWMDVLGIPDDEQVGFINNALELVIGYQGENRTAAFGEQAMPSDTEARMVRDEVRVYKMIKAKDGVRSHASFAYPILPNTNGALRIGVIDDSLVLTNSEDPYDTERAIVMKPQHLSSVLLSLFTQAAKMKGRTPLHYLHGMAEERFNDGS